MWVKAKQAVYLAAEYGGHRKEGEEFEYTGPENEFLEPVEQGPYHAYSLQELKNELTRRNMGVPPNADHRQMSELLVGDDASSEQRGLTPKEIIPAADGSSTDKYGAGTWTDAGQDKDGFPVPKGSAEDVTK